MNPYRRRIEEPEEEIECFDYWRCHTAMPASEMTMYPVDGPDYANEAVCPACLRRYRQLDGLALEVACAA